jgi:DNA-binding LacI/PurR family transcriptional regulator
MKSVTMKDIAQELGVSVQSVSQALNERGRLKDKTRERIIVTAKKMNYHPNILAKGLRDNRTYLLGVVFPYLNESFFNRILGGLEEMSLACSYDILIGNSFINYSKPKDLSSLRQAEKKVLDRMINRKVDGIICTPNQRIPEVYEPLIKDKTLFFQLMKRLPGVEAGFLGVDNVLGGVLATEHLIKLGHEKIGFLNTNFTDYDEISDRNKGYMKALLSSGISHDIDKMEDFSDLSFHEAGKSALRLIKRNPDTTALFAPTDIAALGALQALLEQGRKIPEDISIIGYDDLEVASHQVLYPLSTIAQPKEELGRKAFELFQAQIETGKIESKLLKPELVLRKTTTHPR